MWTGMHCGRYLNSVVWERSWWIQQMQSTNSKACVKGDCKFSESFEIGVGVRHGCEMEERIQRAGAKLKLDSKIWLSMTSFFVLNSVLLA